MRTSRRYVNVEACTLSHLTSFPTSRQMRSALPSSLFRHSLARQAFKQQQSVASRLFVSTKSSQCKHQDAVAAVQKTTLINVLDPSSSDFASLAVRGAFVDKSPALQDFLQVATPIHLLLRPRRSGKTTLLRMFR